MGGKGGKGMDMAQMQRNPQAMLKNLQGAMDPRMMQQMGGQQGMMNMMKQMGNMDSASRSLRLSPSLSVRAVEALHLLTGVLRCDCCRSGCDDVSNGWRWRRRYARRYGSSGYGGDDEVHGRRWGHGWPSWSDGREGWWTWRWQTKMIHVA